MSDIFKELENLINAELKGKGLDITVEVKGSKGRGIPMNLSKTDLKVEENKKLHEALSSAFEKWNKKYFKEI